MNYEMKELGKETLAGFALSIVMTLALSLWSISTLLIGFGMPAWLAIGGGLAFDIPALVAAKIASNYAESPYSPMGPKMWTNLFGLLSMFINGAHGLQLFGPVAMVAFGAFPFITLIIFHLYLKYTGRKALVEVGRFAMPLPIMGWLSWALYPREAFTNLRKTVGVRMRTAVARFENQQNATVTANAIVRHTAKPVAKPENETKALENATTNDVKAIENYANENANGAKESANVANTMNAIDANREVRIAKAANLNANASVNAIVAKGYEEGLRTTDELLPFVNEIKPGVDKAKVSKALSYTKKKYNLEGTGFYA
ncbi:membrane protein [Satellite phage MiniFlayer]|nr:membrane protein [Satellite phage MiniFlayer]